MKSMGGGGVIVTADLPENEYKASGEGSTGPIVEIVDVVEGRQSHAGLQSWPTRHLKFEISSFLEV